MAAASTSDFQSNPLVLSIHGRGLKLDTKADLELYINGIDASKVEEVHFGGNTIGVEAAKYLAEWLSGAKSLQVIPMKCSQPARH